MARMAADDLVSPATAAAATAAVAPAPAEVAGEAMDGAVDFCRRRLGSRVDPVKLLKKNHGEVHEYFRYGLGRQLAAYLGKVDETVKAVYVYSWGTPVEEMEADPVGVTSPLSLLIWVERKTAALESLLAALDAALTQRYQALVAPEASGLHSLLDALLVDDEEVLRRTGYGALLTSIHARPTKVWERDQAW